MLHCTRQQLSWRDLVVKVNLLANATLLCEQKQLAPCLRGHGSAHMQLDGGLKAAHCPNCVLNAPVQPYSLRVPVDRKLVCSPVAALSVESRPVRPGEHIVNGDRGTDAVGICQGCPNTI